MSQVTLPDLSAGTNEVLAAIKTPLTDAQKVVIARTLERAATLAIEKSQGVSDAESQVIDEEWAGLNATLFNYFAMDATAIGSRIYDVVMNLVRVSEDVALTRLGVPAAPPAAINTNVL